MGQRLTGRVALVTGASRGIGRAIAIAFAREGAAAVVCNFHNSEAEATLTSQEIERRGAKALAIRADVTSSNQVEAMVARIGAVFGGLDVLVNNAGALHRASVSELSEEAWDQTIATNLKATFLCVRAALPLLQKRPGVVLNVASGGAGMHGQAPRLAHYYAAKAGLVTYSKCLAAELAPIRVNCLAPGFTETGFGNTQPGTKENVLATTPLGRLGQPADIANAAVFLASDEASFITGHVLVVDGGRMM